MTGNIGFIKRNTAEIRVMDGDPIIAGTTNAPIAEVAISANSKGFLSGEPMVLAPDITDESSPTSVTLNKYVFKDCSALLTLDPADTETITGGSKTVGKYKPVVCFALQDYIIVDGVVVRKADASGFLQGISCLAQNRVIATAFYDATDTYFPGQALTIKAASGLGLPEGNTPRSGYVVAKVTAATDPIVGYVAPEGVISLNQGGSTIGAPVGVDTISASGDPSDGLQYTYGGPTAWVNDSKTLSMLSFTLAWDPKISFD